MATRQLTLDRGQAMAVGANPLVEIFEIWHSIKYGRGIGTTTHLGEENVLRERQIGCPRWPTLHGRD